AAERPPGRRRHDRPGRARAVSRRPAAADRGTNRRAAAPMIRIFVNDRAVSVARGATVRDAVAVLDRELAELLGSGAAYVTDGVGRPVDGGEAGGGGGAIRRVGGGARRGPARLREDLRRRWS